MDRSCLIGTHGDDTITSKEDSISYDEMSFSCSVIICTFESASKIYFLPRCRTDDAGAWVFGFVFLSEDGFFDFASDDTSFVER